MVYIVKQLKKDIWKKNICFYFFESKSGYGSFNFYCRYVTLFFSFDEKSRVHMYYAAMRQSSLRSISPI